ncbi:MAG: putative sensor domain DACNV-containing protein [Deltaproteobacteria bacterium]
MGLTRVRFDWANLRTVNELCGPREFAKALLHEFHAVQQSDFGNWLSFSCSDESVRGVIELAYYASLLEEEGRPTRFRIVFGDDDVDALPYSRLARFDAPVCINDVADVMKIAPALTSQEVALWMTERKGKRTESWLECLGLLNAGVDSQRVMIGFPDAVVTGSQTVVHRQTHLTLSVEGSGHLRASFGLLWEYALRAGVVMPTTLVATTPPLEAVLADSESIVRRRCKALYPDLPLPEYVLQNAREITSLWTRILDTAVSRQHGGAFIILPEETVSLDAIRKTYNIYDGVPVDLDLGAHLAEFSASCGRLFNLRRLTGAESSESLVQQLCDQQNEWLALRGQFQVALNAAAGLSEVDGCVVLDRGLRIGLFGGKIRSSGATSRPSGKALDLRDWYARDVSIEHDIRKLGTRNQSACQFCREHPHALAFVISQDGDLRVYCSDDEAAYAFEALAPC